MSKPITFPAKFIERIEQELPTDLTLAGFKTLCEQELRKSIRVNTLKISLAEFVKLAKHNDWQLTAIPWCQEGFWITRVDESIALGNTAEHLAGLFYVQEASSMLPVSALFYLYPSHKDSLILDAAAAPGSKTTQLAARLNNFGAVIANEYSASRVKVLSANLLRCGVINTAITHFSAEVFGQWMPEKFDAILLDAPCSGEGTLRKDPKALENWSEQHLLDVSALQFKLLESALFALKPGGVLVYSTCTLNRQENQQVLARLMGAYPEQIEALSLSGLFEGCERALTEQGYLHVWPHYFDSEGFFVAALRKSQLKMPTEKITKIIKPFAYQKASSKQLQAITRHFSEQFALSLPDEFSVFVKGDDYWLLPNAFLSVKDQMRFERVGLKLATAFKHGFRTSHDAVTSLGDKIASNKVTLNEQQAHQFYQGKDISYPNNNRGELVVVYQERVIGLGKWVRNKIKNGYPRELVKDKGLY